MIASGVFGLLWFILLVVLGGVGSYAKATSSAFVIAFLLPFWFAAYIMPDFAGRLWFIGPPIKIAKKVFGPVLVIAAAFLLFGLWSPEVKEGFDTWSYGKKLSLANTLKERDAKSASRIGVIGELAEKSWVYDDKNNPLGEYIASTPVKAVDIKGKSPVVNEGMVKIMLTNPQGDFVGGNIVYVPNRKVKWS